MNNFLIHIICGEAVISIQHTSAVPRIGDELRLPWNGEPRFYIVTRVVWVYDEDNAHYERVNIAVKEDADE